jgi:hypothetical protein
MQRKKINKVKMHEKSNELPEKTKKPDMSNLQEVMKWVSTAKLHELITTKEQADRFMKKLRALKK